MLYQKYFRNDITRKYIVGFASLFNGISVVRRNENGDELQRTKVPISYISKAKFLGVLSEDGNDDKRKTAITLPRLSFEILGYNYAPERKLSSKRKTTTSPNSYTRKYFYNPVPYDLSMNLYLYTKSQDEGYQIIEQILPFFAPEYTISLKLLDPVGDEVIHDIPIVLTSVDCTDNGTGPLEDNRQIIWTLAFQVKGYYYGPVRTQGLITRTIVKIYDGVYGEADPESYIYKKIDGINSNPTTIAQQENGLISILKINRGIDYNVSFLVEDQNGNPFDLTDWTIKSSLRESLISTTSVEFPSIKLDQTSNTGKFTLTLPGTTSSSMLLDKYVYDVELENSEGFILHVYDGIAEIS